jgi:hypothetical protein
MTRSISNATVPARFLTCPPSCPHCVDFPGHQASAYNLGVGYGQALHPVEPAVEVAYVEQRLRAADRLTEPFLTGVYDTLTAVTS